MFAIRYFKMWVRRKDGLMTDDKERAMLFHSVDEAENYVTDGWKDKMCTGNTEPIEIVEVACKQVISKVGLVHKTIGGSDEGL